MIKPSLGEFSSGQYRLHKRMRGCVAHYALIEQGGLALYDYAYRQYSGSLTGTSTDPSWSIGKYGPSLSFDGVNDLAILNISTNLDFPNQKATMCLIYKATAGNPGYILAKRLGSTESLPGLNGGYFLRVNTTGTLTARIVDSGNLSAGERSTVGTNYLDGNYHTISVIFTFDTVTLANNDVTIYADGLLDQGSRSDSGAGPYQPGISKHLVLGATSDATSFLTGAIEDIRLYDRELSYGEILSYYLNPYLEFEYKPRRYNFIDTTLSSAGKRLLLGVG